MLVGAVAGEDPLVPGRPVRAWSVKAVGGDDSITQLPIDTLRKRMRVHPAFARDVDDLMQPGSVLLVRRDKSRKDIRSEKGFMVTNPGWALFSFGRFPG
jgi:hypothetical protein